MRLISRFWDDNTGQDLVEYGLIAVLVSTATIAAIKGFGATVALMWAKWVVRIPN